MRRIKESTTLAELSVELSKYGVVHTALIADAEMLQPFFAVLSTASGAHRGRGDTPAEALDDALARAVHVEAERLTSAPRPDCDCNVCAYAKKHPQTNARRCWEPSK